MSGNGHSAVLLVRPLLEGRQLEHLRMIDSPYFPREALSVKDIAWCGQPQLQSLSVEGAALVHHLIEQWSDPDADTTQWRLRKLALHSVDTLQVTPQWWRRLLRLRTLRVEAHFVDAAFLQGLAGCVELEHLHLDLDGLGDADRSEWQQHLCDAPSLITALDCWTRLANVAVEFAPRLVDEDVDECVQTLARQATISKLRLPSACTSPVARTAPAVEALTSLQYGSRRSSGST